MIKVLLQKFRLIIIKYLRLQTLHKSYNFKYNLILHGKAELLTIDKSLKYPASLYCNTRSGIINIAKNVGFGEDVKLLTGRHYNIEQANETGKIFSLDKTRNHDVI